MLYFWYYEPIEYLHSKDKDNYLNFCKVIHNLGFYMPTGEQALICHTLNLITAIEQATTIENKKDKIYDLWEAYDVGEAYDITHIIKAFSLVREFGFFDKDFNKASFDLLSDRLRKLFILWKTRHPSKEQIYQSLII